MSLIVTDFFRHMLPFQNSALVRKQGRTDVTTIPFGKAMKTRATLAFVIICAFSNAQRYYSSILAISSCSGGKGGS
jgi:hypothetical protein